MSENNYAFDPNGERVEVLRPVTERHSLADRPGERIGRASAGIATMLVRYPDGHTEQVSEMDLIPAEDD